MNTVLIIEDDKMLASMYQDKFQFSNFTVITAEDGKKGLELALSSKPNLILLDLALPKIKGLDILKALRADSWGTAVPIIVLTNVTVDGKVLEGIMKYTPVYCLLKANTTPEEVVTKAREILN